MLSSAAEHKVAASEHAPLEPRGRTSARPTAVPCKESSRQGVSVVGLLAAWKDVTLQQMARTLLGMTAAERTELRKQYAKVEVLDQV